MIKLPNLDDLSFSDLVNEARAQIPTLAPAWTDHNPTDPGIVLIEMFAWLTEMVLYRLNRIPQKNYETFLKLLNDPGWTLTQDLQSAIRDTLLKVRERHRAVTPDDFEYLALQSWKDDSRAIGLGDSATIRRARCVPEQNLEVGTSAAPGHVSVVVVPGAPGSSLPASPPAAVLAALWSFLDERRLLTTRHHVVGPTYVPVTVSATLYLRPDAKVVNVKSDADAAIRRYFHPLAGGPDGKGWTFGHSVNISDVCNQLVSVAGVDFVGLAGEVVNQDVAFQAVSLTATNRQPQADGSIALLDHELPDVTAPAAGLQLMDYVGGKWKPIR